VRLCLLAILGEIFVLTRPADACTCSSPAQACDALARAEVVFVGRVKDAVRRPQRDPETTVTVEEVFRGSPGTGRVSGRVTLADGTPRANIEVRAAGTSLATRTNAQGEYQLSPNGADPLGRARGKVSDVQKGRGHSMNSLLESI
jgi:hypothetical protein